MARVTIRLPSLLGSLVGERREIVVQAETVENALSELLRAWPILRVHLFDETGGFRPHVLCFHNETCTRWMESLATPVRDGDVITLLQAVSGG